MLILSEAQVLEHIEHLEPFEGFVEHTGMYIKVDQYVSYIATAIHAGSKLREALKTYCLLDESERYYEEDPGTETFISECPIQVVGMDSRYEYDLNRPIARAVYQVAWGKQVWKQALSKKQKDVSWDKHRTWYRLFEALVLKIESLFGACLIFDVHSYNHQRIPGEPPSVNLGTEQIDLERWGSTVSRFEKSLKQSLANTEHRVARNEVFQGMGYLITHINSHFTQVLVIPAEIKKFYMDENKGELYPQEMEFVRTALGQSINLTAQYFEKQHVKKRKKSIQKNKLQPSKTHDLISLDAKLYQLAKGINTLQAVAPLNLQSEKQKFLKKEGRYSPNFIYKSLDIDPYWFREQLYRLPIHQIEHAVLRGMYRDVVDMLATKIDLLTSIGTDRFLYNSLRYYGEPKEIDLKNARFLVQAPPLPSEKLPQDYVDAKAAVEYFVEKSEEWGYQCQVSIGRKMVAKALVNHGNNALMVNQHSQFTQSELRALAHHELGVHMVTTLNAKRQPLKLFELGLPGNTKTQEGLAILMEDLSGNLTLSRLKTLALRVLAVHTMIQHNDFQKTFALLKEKYGVKAESAFDICIRVHRGGGFTKDFLYLSGLRDALKLHKDSTLVPLLVGKTGFDYLQGIEQLIQEGVLNAPSWVSPALLDSSPRNQVLDYLVSAIR